MDIRNSFSFNFSNEETKTNKQKKNIKDIKKKKKKQCQRVKNFTLVTLCLHPDLDSEKFRPWSRLKNNLDLDNLDLDLDLEKIRCSFQTEKNKNACQHCVAHVLSYSNIMYYQVLRREPSSGNIWNQNLSCEPPGVIRWN